jgi:hypothetical protein
VASSNLALSTNQEAGASLSKTESTQVFIVISKQNMFYLEEPE